MKLLMERPMQPLAPRFVSLALASALLTSTAGIQAAETGHAHEHQTSNHLNHGAAGHAPIGVMGDHTHGKGEVMFSARFMQMLMDGNRDNSDDLSIAQVHENFVVAPVEMTTHMLILGMMYAPSDRLTLMVMAPYVEKTMNHQTRPGVGGPDGISFETEGKAVGDLKLGGLWGLWQDGHLNIGLSLPTGSIDERDNNPRCQMMGTCPSRLPYPMQIGSGTYDLQLGATQRLRQGAWSGGGQALATLRLGRNEQGYSLGDSYELNAWAAREINPSFSSSLRLKFSKWENIDGQDDEIGNLPAQFIPTARTDLRAGQRLDLGFGLNVQLEQAHRIGVEYLVPLLQHLDGPQLQVDDALIIGYQYSY